MKPNLFTEWKNEIREFCQKNQLDFEAISKLSKGYGRDFLAFCCYDPGKGTKGLLDDTPMPLVLMVRKTKDGLVFEMTEYTDRYLKHAS